MPIIQVWLVVGAIALFPAAICRKGWFRTAALVAITWLGAAIWAWTSSTDNRHLDYALAAVGGDPRMIFAVGTVFFGLPIYTFGALIGVVFHLSNKAGPNGSAEYEGKLT